MKPSAFLKNRFPTALSEVAGEGVVSYTAMGAPTVDGLTGDVDEATAYTASPISLDALVDFSPSQAVRDKLGRDQKFDAILIISKQQISDHSIDLQVGDAFVLPDDTNRYLMRKVVLDKQAGGEYLQYTVAVHRVEGQ